MSEKINEDYLSGWQGFSEKIGYAIADYDKIQNWLAVLHSIKTGEGTFGNVEEENLELFGKLDLLRKKEYGAFEIIPAHSHPVMGASTKDEEKMKMMSKFGYHNFIIICPSEVKSYNIENGRITPNTIVVLPREKITQKYNGRIIQLEGVLKNLDLIE